MKRNVMLSLIAAFVLFACGSTVCFGDGPEPICYPGAPCATNLSDGPVPICYPGHPCILR
jgi:hypothetical protein